MSSRLIKKADAMGIQTELYLLLEKEITKKAQEIGWNEPIEGITELIDQNLSTYGIGNIQQIAEAINVAIERWAEETKENFPDGSNY